MKIAVIGTGYVGLVTGVCLAEIGHEVTCIDIVEEKIKKLKKGMSPIYEPGIEELMKKNIKRGRLCFTSDHKEGFSDAEIVLIAVGTPQKLDGSADLSFIEQTAKDIASHINHNIIVVTKSTVPIGTNEYIKETIAKHLTKNVKVEIASNPEFLREGSAIYDTFHGDRIIIGVENEIVYKIMKKMYRPFNVPIFKTDIRSAEMIKYASNAFLATKISYINEVSNYCEKVGANIEDVTKGMGLDQRISQKFLNAGIGFGGSCFPKDTSAFIKMAEDEHLDFKILESVISVNNIQKKCLVQKAVDRFGSLHGKQVTLLGLSFKPNTDDMREAASIAIVEELLNHRASIIAYDPIAIPNAKKIFHSQISYANSVSTAITDSNCAFILTEWEEFKKYDLIKFAELMKEPIVFDGRNCFSLDQVQKANIEYHSMGRPTVHKN